MTEKPVSPYQYHRRPAADNGPCSICGLPLKGPGFSLTTSHRAVAHTEGLPFRFMARETARPDGENGASVRCRRYESKSRPSSIPAIGTAARLEIRAVAELQVPAREISARGRYHRFIAHTEGIPFVWMVRFHEVAGDDSSAWKEVGISPKPLPEAGPPVQDHLPPDDVPPLDSLPPDDVPPPAAVPTGPDDTTLASTARAAQSAAVPTGPDNTTLALIARAALLFTMKPKTRDFDASITKALDLARGTLNRWRREWPEYWKAALDISAQQLLQTVRARVGTAAILTDPDRWLQEAEAAERIAASRGESLLPVPTRPTLTTFFESYYLNVRLHDKSAGAVRNYRVAMKSWRLITGDPPLEEITTESFALFRDAISKRRGLKPHLRTSANTVHHKLVLIQSVLDLAGPVDRGHRDAAGILKSIPWLRPPKVVLKTPREIPGEVLQQIYLATAGMDVPWVDGIKPPAWWKALLVVAYNTQLRRRTLFEMRTEEIDWPNHRIILPAERLKSGRPMVVHLNAAALEALQAIRTTRELIFPWPTDKRNFYKYLHRLQASIGLPKKEWFGLHAIRSTAATVLAGFSPQASQLSLGHTQLAVTVNHYIRTAGIIQTALDAMPQPWAEKEGTQT